MFLKPLFFADRLLTLFTSCPERRVSEDELDLAKGAHRQHHKRQNFHARPLMEIQRQLVTLFIAAALLQADFR